MRILKCLIILAEMAILVFMLVLGSRFLTVDMDMEWKESAEVGEDIAFYFNQPIIPESFEENFQINNPDLAGDFIWRDKNREVHFSPIFLIRGGNYDVKITSARSYFLTALKNKEYHFKFSVRSEDNFIAENNDTRFIAPVDLPIVSDLPAVVNKPKEKKIPAKSNNAKAEISQLKISEEKYIDIDIGKMIGTAFENGKPVFTFAVAGIGNPAISPTPTGNFKVLFKHPKHFSSISHVWMPWSVNFYGPYFLHGIPYWPNGDKLNTRYSGGCVRLPEEVDKTIYDFVEVGTPIVISKSKSEVSLR